MAIILLERKDGFLRIGDYCALGAFAAKCPNKNAPYANTWVMTADLFSGSDSNVGTMLWRSFDGGESWEEQGLIEKSYQCDLEGSMIKSGYGGLYADERTGVLLFLASDTYWHKGEYESIKKCRRLYTRLSYDNGLSWTDKRYIIEDGEGYDSEHFMKDVVYGRNMAAIVGPQVIRADDGSLLVSVQAQVVDEKGEMIEPSGFGFYRAGALKAFWNAEKQDYDWCFGEFVEVTPDESARGVFEPTFAKRGLHSLIMVMRGSNMHINENMPGTKFFSISNDDGWTWTRPERLRYDDGEIMYSSSCIPKLLCHSNGKTYFVGVICDLNPDGNLPRYPLCIAELDTESACVRRESVVYLDTRRETQAEPARYPVDYSNHCVYEDEHGNIVVLAPYRADTNKFAASLNRYLIGLSSGYR